MHNLIVPIRVRAYRKPKVMWLNKRWLISQNVLCDLTDSAIIECENWLIASFAYGLPLSQADEIHFTQESKTFYVDRYGNANGFVQSGGSGRAAISDGFQIKGIGPTPLVDSNADWLHSHGCIWLEEAFREVVYSELVAAEFPYGAVPVVAVIDTGVSALGDGRDYERRALLVRPFVYRVAHLDRAAGFLPRNQERAAQISDYRRVRECWTALVEGKGDPIKIFKQILHRAVLQLAFAAVYRIYPGGYFSSLFSIDGALVDFGAFRTVKDWARTFATSHVQPFGDELPALRVILHSLVHEGVKHLDRKLDCGSLTDWLVKDYGACFERLINEAIGGHGAMRKVAYNAISKAYLLDQRYVRDYTAGIFPSIAPKTDLIEAVLDDVREGLETYSSPDLRALHYRLFRFFYPRENLDREPLQGTLFRYVAELENGRTNVSFDEILSKELTKGRRYWSDIGNAEAVLGQLCSPTTCALICMNCQSGQLSVRVRAEDTGRHAFIFDRLIDRRAIRAPASCTTTHVEYILPLESATLGCVNNSLSEAFGFEAKVPPLFYYMDGAV